MLQSLNIKLTFKGINDPKQCKCKGRFTTSCTATYTNLKANQKYNNILMIIIKN